MTATTTTTATPHYCVQQQHIRHPIHIYIYIIQIDIRVFWTPQRGRRAEKIPILHVSRSTIGTPVARINHKKTADRFPPHRRRGRPYKPHVSRDVSRTCIRRVCLGFVFVTFIPPPSPPPASGSPRITFRLELPSSETVFRNEQSERFCCRAVKVTVTIHHIGLCIT